MKHDLNHDLNRFSFWHNKKSKSLGNSDDIADQITRRNDASPSRYRAETYAYDMFIS